MIRYIFRALEWTFLLYVVIRFTHKLIIKNGWTTWYKPVEEYDLWDNKRIMGVCFLISLVPLLRFFILLLWGYCAFKEKK